MINIKYFRYFSLIDWITANCLQHVTMSEKRTMKEDPKPSSREQEVVEEDIVGAAAIKPPGWDRKGWEYLKFFLYDPEQGTIFGRTPRSWLLITIFYLVFYTGLLLFWFSLLGIFFQTLPTHSDGPRYTVENSLIGANPGQYWFIGCPLFPVLTTT